MLKNNLSINDYVLKLKELADQLETAVYALTEEDKVMYLVAGLDRDFKSVVSTIYGKMKNEM